MRGQVPDRTGGSADAADVHSGVLLRLTAHLWALRADPSAEPLESFAGYVAAAAHNACHAFFRTRHPQRSRLRNKIRYVLTREPGLALWAGDRHAWLAGRSAWKERPAGADTAMRLADASGRLGPRPFPELVRTLIDHAGGPCRLEQLADAVGRVLGVSDESVSLSEESEVAPSMESRLADQAPSAADQIDTRRYLERLWGEICELPIHQRAALLLNLRDEGGSGMIGLHPGHGGGQRGTDRGSRRPSGRPAGGAVAAPARGRRVDRQGATGQPQAGHQLPEMRARAAGPSHAQGAATENGREWYHSPSVRLCTRGEGLKFAKRDIR